MKYIYLLGGIILILNSFIQFFCSIVENGDAGRLALSLIFFMIGLPTTIFSIIAIQESRK